MNINIEICTHLISINANENETTTVSIWVEGASEKWVDAERM